MKKILVIQTAFIGDVVLATGILEKLHENYPAAKIDFLLRKGNEGLLSNHPFLGQLLVWDKKSSKYANLWKILKNIRSEKYDLVINLQRFAASGLLTVLSGAAKTYGFSKNPLSTLFTRSFPHDIGKKGDLNYQHETDRNHELIKELTDDVPAKPRLYPSNGDFESVATYKNRPYITISPASVWFTKQFPEESWIKFIMLLPESLSVFLTGGPGDTALAERIARVSGHKNTTILAGKLSFLQTAALMKDAVMNYVNDSAPMHFASAMNAPVTAVYCSTIPEFGFGPLSDKAWVVETKEYLDCRPCGLHGFKECPKEHFKCAFGIQISELKQIIET